MKMPFISKDIENIEDEKKQEARKKEIEKQMKEDAEIAMKLMVENEEKKRIEQEKKEREMKEKMEAEDKELKKKKEELEHKFRLELKKKKEAKDVEEKKFKKKARSVGENKRRDMLEANLEDLKATKGAILVVSEDTITTRYGYAFSRDEIAEGSTSKMYRGETGSEQLMVKIIQLKLLEPNLANNIVEFGCQVYRFLISHNHPNIIKFYEVFMTKEKIYIFMDYIEGSKTLSDRIKVGLIESEILNYEKQVGEALCFLHDNGIGHRNLSTRSFLTKEDRIYMFQFNSSRICWTDPDTLYPFALPIITDNTPHPAPEEIDNPNPINPMKTDIWKYGELILTMFLKMHHFKLRSKEPIKKQWNQATMKPELQAHPKVIDMLSKIFVKDPNKRPEMYDVLSCSWFRN